MKILIVDDSKTMRTLIKRTLRMAGYGDHETVEAENGAAALAILDKLTPDLILSDWNMPEMSGLELLQALKEQGSSINRGFVTTEATAQMRGLAAKEGARFLVTKPFTPETIQAALEPFLES